MIDKTMILDAVLARAHRLPEGHYLDMRTYKRNRSVLIIKQGEDEFLIIEDGYALSRYSVRADKLKKELRSILRREFRRSHKIRLYTMGEFREEAAANIRRKKL
ncbi:MAG: hypothetical protein ACOYVJ_07290 [Nitrospirota bacterium]